MIPSSLYRTLWRWHFYAGLFCIPFVMILAVSGAIYLFKPQLEQWREQPYSGLTPGTRATPNQQIAAALEARPGALFQSYRLPQLPTDAVRISLLDQGQRYYLYVDPFTLKVLHQQAFDHVFVEWVKNLHGELLVGKYGSWLVELAASWAILLLLTGLYLWWPRNGSGLGGVLYPRWRTNGRAFWKDLHAVVGFWVALFALFLLISGLPWTSVWGSAFKETRSLLTQINSQDWSQSQVARTQSWRMQAVSQYNLSPQTLAAAQSLNFAWPSELSLSNATESQWKLASMHQNRPRRQTAWIDGQSNQVQVIQNFSDKPLVDRIVGIGIAAHEGQLFGWLNQLLGVLTALGLLALSISGFTMWRQRKPAGRLGAPKPLSGFNTKRTRVNKLFPGLCLLAAISLPLVGASLLCLLLLEMVLLRKIPSVRLWLGLK